MLLAQANASIGTIDNISNSYAFSNIGTLGELLSYLGTPLFAIATTAVVFYFTIGIFKFITSGGDKEALASARAMMVHAILGFLILIMVFLVVKLVPQFLGVSGLSVIR